MLSVLSLLLLLVGLASASPTIVKRTVTTPLGALTGTTTISGVRRFVFKYAQAPRWRASQAVSSFKPLSTLPPVCAQPVQDGSGNWIGVEDCLYIVLYVPSNLNGQTLVWFHGGSLLVGGADDSAIEGSKLAVATQSVVAVVQYRLGVLGWLPPAANTSATNLGVRDAIVALQLLNTVLPSFYANQITLGGHSAGSMLIRALLAAPSASNLFTKAILLSDPMAYGLYNASTLTTLQGAFYPSVGCTPTDGACHDALSLDTILQAQMAFVPTDYDASTAGNIPFRPTKDGSLITTSLTTTFPSTLKPLLVTSTHDEAGAFIYAGVPALPAEYYSGVLSSVIPDFRAAAIEASPYYALDLNDEDTLRKTLKTVITDLGWRCSVHKFAKQWATRGGKVWTGEVLRGATYSLNAGVPFCATSELQVCHQNDIPIVFATATTTSTTKTILTNELQARFKAFIQNSNSDPNTSTYSGWARTTANAANIRPFGSNATLSQFGPCNDFWGTPAAPLDWQMFGL